MIFGLIRVKVTMVVLLIFGVLHIFLEDVIITHKKDVSTLFNFWGTPSSQPRFWLEHFQGSVVFVSNICIFYPKPQLLHIAFIHFLRCHIELFKFLFDLCSSREWGTIEVTSCFLYFANSQVKERIDQSVNNNLP